MMPRPAFFLGFALLTACGGEFASGEGGGAGATTTTIGSGGGATGTTTTTGAGGGDTTGGGGAGACVPSACDAPANECDVATCTGGVCGIGHAAAGKPLAVDTPKDCRRDVCDGSGGTKKKADDSDLPIDGKACTRDVCSNGVAANPPDVAAGTPCSEDGGAVCDGAGACVECLTGAECTAPGKPVCKDHHCVTATCGDEILDGNETATDCGGDCAPCADGSHCNVDADCQNGRCSLGTCAPATCSDGLKNGRETDVDCGVSAVGVGPQCPACPANATCATNADCAGGSCNGGTCTPTCSDGEQDQNETDVDCGGVCAQSNPLWRCADGKSCVGPADCAGLVCTANGTCCTPVPKAEVCKATCGLVTDACGSAIDCGIAQCNEYACLNGACAGTCPSNDAQGSLWCAPGFWCNGSSCAAKFGAGHACLPQGDFQCASGKCTFNNQAWWCQ